MTKDDYLKFLQHFHIYQLDEADRIVQRAMGYTTPSISLLVGSWLLISIHIDNYQSLTTFSFFAIALGGISGLAATLSLGMILLALEGRAYQNISSQVKFKAWLDKESDHEKVGRDQLISDLTKTYDANTQVNRRRFKILKKNSASTRHWLCSTCAFRHDGTWISGRKEGDDREQIKPV